MAAISQTTFSLKFVPGSPVNNIPALAQLVGLAPIRRLDIVWANADRVHWRIYVELGGDELNASLDM